MVWVTSTIFWSPQLHSFYDYNLVEKLASFVESVSPFKAYKSAFLVRFVVF